jgi:hypothetical protein
LGASHSGIRLLLAFGLHEIPAKVPGNRAFIMNIAESGSPVSMQYKEALQESGVLNSQKDKNKTLRSTLAAK